MPNPNPPNPQNPEPRPGEQPPKPANPPAPTPPNPGQPPEPSAQELADQIAAQAVAAQAPKPAAAPVTEPPKEIEYTTENGIKFKGKDWQDIANQVGRSVAHGSAEINRLRQVVRTATGEQPSEHESPQFSQKRYFELMVSEKPDEGPLAAQRYALAHMFNIPEDRVVPAITDAVEEAVDYKQRKVLNEFLVSNPDFPGDQASVDALWQKMIDNDSPMTQAAFRTAHQACLQEHKYEPYVPETQGTPLVNTTTGAVAPLPLARSSAATSAPPPTDINRKAEEAMSPQQIKELVAELQSRGVVQ